MARPLAAVADGAADRIAALQAAFDATMKDPQYLADARKIGLDTNWVAGKDIARMVRQIQETPQPVVDRLRQLLARASKK
jgi:hypothetical protein